MFMECFEQVYFGNDAFNHALFSLNYERVTGGQSLFSKIAKNPIIKNITPNVIKKMISIHKTKYLMENKPKTLKNKQNNSINTL